MLIVAGAAIVVVAVVVGLAPTIASSMAPGQIEKAVNGGIQGRIKVAKAKIGWFKTLEAGPIEVQDSTGALVGRVELDAPVTIWKALSGRWWSAKSLNIGTVEVSGLLDLKQYNDGTTNLQRALAPKTGTASKAKSPAETDTTSQSTLPSVKAGLKVSDFDISVRDEKDNFKSELGLKDLKGEASIDADFGAPGGGVIKALADFAGTALLPNAQGAGQPMMLKLDADIKQNASGKMSVEGIDNAKLKLNLTNAPIAVADALAHLGGALVEGVGDTADLAAEFGGNINAMTAAFKLTSAGLTTDANLTIKDGVLSGSSAGTTGKPASAMLRSTAFLERLPQTQASVAKAREQIKLTQAPSVEITLDSLSIPLPKQGLSGGAGKFETIDMRGANLGLTVKVSGLSGQVAIPESGRSAPAGGATPPANWKAFSVEPITLALKIDDLSKPLNIATGTKATLDGQPAGDLTIALNAEGLLDANGHLRAMQANAGFADKTDIRFDGKGISTALLQPIAAGTGLPVDLSMDIGPRLDLSLQARSDVKGLTGAPAGTGVMAIPPSDLVVKVTSANLNADIEAKIDRGTLTTTGKGMKLSVASASPLAQRILAAGATVEKPAPATVGGRGAVEVIARDVSIPLSEKAFDKLIAAGRGVVAITLSDLTVSPNLGGDTTPIRIDLFNTTATLAPGAAPRIVVNSGMAHEGGTFGLDGELSLEGLRKGMPASKGPGALAELNPVGTIALKNLPRSMLWVVGGLRDSYSENGVKAVKDELSRALAAAVREAIGANLTTTLRLLPAEAATGGGQFANLKVDTASKGVAIDIWTRLTEKEAELSSAVVTIAGDPRTINPVLATLGAADSPMRLGAPCKLYITMEQPAKVPLIEDQTGAIKPDWAKAGEANIKLALEGDALIENILVEDTTSKGGSKRFAAASIRGFTGNIKAPLAGLDPALASTRRANVKLNASLINRTNGDAPIGTFAVDASATMAGAQPEVDATISGLSFTQAESLLGQKGMIVGALGETGEVQMKVKPMAKGSMPNTTGDITTIEVRMTSPRVSGASVGLAIDETRIFLTKPSTITWTPNEAMINEFLSGGTKTPPVPQDANRPRGAGESGSGGSLSLQNAKPITIQLEKLSLSKPRAASEGVAAVGPLKPGVFDLGLNISAPSMSVNVPTSESGKGAAGPAFTTMTIENLTVGMRSLAPEGNGSSPIEARLNIGKVSGNAAATGKASTATIKIANLADAMGNISQATALVNADVDIEAFPTPIVDKLANQNGLLTELLGPTVSLVATARNVSPAATSAGGSLDVLCSSQRATAKLKGDVKTGQFVQSGATSVEVREIRSQLVQLLAGSLPLVENLEKSGTDEPATIIAEGLTVPIEPNADLRKLNGRLTVDVGVAKFTTNDLIGKIIKSIGGKDGGAIGRKIEPFVVNISRGVATYERFKLPFGEFNLETRGQVDLVQKQVNVVTYAPFFALSEEALGKIRIGIPGKFDIIDRNTLVPITTKGSLDNPRTELDLGLFFQELGEKLFNPENLLKEPGKILEDLFKPKETPAAPTPAPAPPSATPPKPKPPAASPPATPAPTPVTPAPENPPAKPKKPKKPKDDPKPPA